MQFHLDLSALKRKYRIFVVSMIVCIFVMQCVKGLDYHFISIKSDSRRMYTYTHENFQFANPTLASCSLVSMVEGLRGRS